MFRRLFLLFRVLIALGAPVAAAADAPPLPALAADAERLTVSGISSGGYMAVQFHVAHSTLVDGAGVIAAGPYDCARGSITRALNNCMTPEPGAQPPDPAQTLAHIESEARAGHIDLTAGFRGDRAWILALGADATVERPVVDALLGFYRRVLPPDAVRFVEVPNAAHGFVSIADPQANGCDTSEPPFINRCGDVDAAGLLLAHLIGPLAPRSPAPDGELLSFDQRPFAPLAPLDLSLADRGYAYVPRACRNGGCAIHVAFHGCRQTEAQVGRRFVEGAGYNAWADTNRVIVLYPQARPRSGFAWGSWRWVYNPRGCWDWWGYTGPAYATRDGKQISTVRAMIERLAERPAPAPVER